MNGPRVAGEPLLGGPTKRRAVLGVALTDDGRVEELRTYDDVRVARRLLTALDRLRWSLAKELCAYEAQSPAEVAAARILPGDEE